MKKIWLTVLVLLGLLAGVISFIFFFPHGAAEVTAPESSQASKVQSGLHPVQTDLHVVGIGDSLTKGVGAPEVQGYAGMTVNTLETWPGVDQVEFEDYGVRGDTTDDLLDVLKKDEVRDSLKSADMIFMTIGGNDLVDVLKDHFLDLRVQDFNQQKKHFTANFNQILEEIRAVNPDATIYYMGLYNPFEDYFVSLNDQFNAIVASWNAAAESLLAEHEPAVFVPMFDIFHGHTDTLLYTDHFHPNREGYTLISNRLVEAIKENGSIN